MSAAGWVRWLLAAVMLAGAVFHLARLTRLVRARHRGGMDLDVAHAAMGTMMAAMLVGAPGVPLALVLFAAGAAWFVVRTVRGFVLVGGSAVAPPAQASVGCIAMVVMLAGSVGASGHAMAAAAGSRGDAMTMPTGDYRVAGVAVVAATIALAGWTVTRWQREHRMKPLPRLALGCQLAMNVTTVTMLALR